MQRLGRNVQQSIQRHDPAHHRTLVQWQGGNAHLRSHLSYVETSLTRSLSLRLTDIEQPRLSAGNSSFGFGFGIPPCYYGNKTGEWSVNATFIVPAEYPDAHAALTVTFGAGTRLSSPREIQRHLRHLIPAPPIATEAANLPDQGVLYSVTSYVDLAYVNFVLPTFNESYTGYDVNFTVSTSGRSLAELGNVTFTSSTSCILDGSVCWCSSVSLSLL